ncbi:MAG: hypothetical protein KAT16_06270 [Candidatus Heimdallarchaeota archaeon]|nr:hypothetical protein [Candidatus Heimdallarchaeota archaeon]
MEKVLEKKLSHIESLLIELHMKIDNFLGFETLTEEEKKEVQTIREEIQAGQIEKFEKVFEE